MISAPLIIEANPFEGLSPTSEAALTAFDAAFQPFSPDDSLLAGAPARELTEAMGASVAAVTKMDVDRVARLNGWWARFTGADLEARLELEAAAIGFSTDMQRLSVAATRARRAREAMKVDTARLTTVTAAHITLSVRTAEFLRGADSTAPNVARLERRLANLDVATASNQLAAAQMAMAIDTLSDLLDRYADIETRLYPVWCHHALAVAQSGGYENSGASFEELRKIKKRLTALNEPKEATVS